MFFPDMAGHPERPNTSAMFHLFFPKTILYTQLPSFRSLAIILSVKTKPLTCGVLFSRPAQTPMILRLLFRHSRGSPNPDSPLNLCAGHCSNSVFLPIRSSVFRILMAWAVQLLHCSQSLTKPSLVTKSAQKSIPPDNVLSGLLDFYQVKVPSRHFRLGIILKLGLYIVFGFLMNYKL